MDFHQKQKKNFKRIINHFVGQGDDKEMSVDQLALLTGINKKSIQEHLKEYSGMPTWPHILLYMKALPPAFTDALLSDADLSVTRADEHEAPTSHEAMVHIAGTMHELAQALEDKKVDAREMQKLSPRLRGLGQSLIALSNNYDDQIFMEAAE